MAKLVFQTKDFAHQVYNLVLEKTSVGRGPDNTLVIHDNSVSVHHCDILVYGSEVIVRDQHSTNGTFINDVRVTGQAPAKSGQLLRFGSVEARLELEPPTTTDLATDHTAVRAFSRAVRDQRRARAAPKPEAVLEPEVPGAAADHTSVTARPEGGPPPESPRPGVPVEAAAPPARKRWPMVAVIVGVLIGLGLIFWAWWQWVRG